MKPKNIPLIGTVFTKTTDESTCEVFTVGNVLLPAGVSAPKGGISFYYGAKTTSTQSLSLAFRHANDMGTNLVQINFEVVGNCADGMLTKDELPEAKFMHLERIDRYIADLICPLFVAFMNKHGRSFTNVSSVKMLCSEIARNIDFVSELHNDEAFNHLDVIVYPVIEDDGKRSVRGILFRDENLNYDTFYSPIFENAKFELDRTLFKPSSGDLVDNLTLNKTNENHSRSLSM
ncbi:hypothetical protein [Aeromonas veronii]|uniref:Uncharacterized protein n=1 Tax=Aeromonas veronii TaxID=654 RepID=A0A4S5CDM5_AERVE|nr:hypothetical protein [Aeromonas veronii]THJ43579.1 hypothetical protein E8Q35_14830 [Aeromonas veronii]